MRIVFMGTPDFAVPSLSVLVENNYQVVAVITAPDRMGGRGMKQVLETPVKKYALSQGIPVLQPVNLKNANFLRELQSYQADLQVVVAFRMLPEVVWNMPPLGTFNLHGSLLPKYRGAAPINWAVIQGETTTGVTTFFLQHAIDTGNILFQASTAIHPDESVGDVHDRLMGIGAALVLKTVQAIENGEATPIPQNEEAVTHAPKLFMENCEINFHQATKQVHDFIRGLSPFPTAWTNLDGQVLKIYLAKPFEGMAPPLAPGTFYMPTKRSGVFGTTDGAIELLDVQLQGRKRMPATDFFNGYQPLEK